LAGSGVADGDDGAGRRDSSTAASGVTDNRDGDSGSDALQGDDGDV
jgi:hypothetical protein